MRALDSSEVFRDRREAFLGWGRNWGGKEAGPGGSVPLDPELCVGPFGLVRPVIYLVQCGKLNLEQSCA